MPALTRKGKRDLQAIADASNGAPLTHTASSNQDQPDAPDPDADPGDAAPPPPPPAASPQDEQMSKTPPILLDLQHSADNHEASDHDLTFTYPSGAEEHFALGERVKKRTHRLARPLTPIEDLIRTIHVLRIENGSSTAAELQLIRTIVQTAYDSRDDLSAANLPSLQEQITSYNQPQQQKKKKKKKNNSGPSSTLIEHFFDQLHDRCIADDANLLERPGSSDRENTYGELTPPFVSTLCLQTSLSPTSTFVDLGSGVGQICMQTSLETQCTSFGVEREGRCHVVAITHLAQFKERAKLWGLEHGGVHLKKGDFLASWFIGEWIGRADVLLVNNLKLGPETDLALQGVLAKGLKSGAQVISTRPLTPIGRERGKRKAAADVGEDGEVEVDEEPVRKKTTRTKGKAKAKPKGRGRGKRPPKKANVLPTPAHTPAPEPEPVADRGDGDLVERSGEDENWTWKQYVYAAGSVSWSDKEGLYYISTKK